MNVEDLVDVDITDSDRNTLEVRLRMKGQPARVLALSAAMRLADDGNKERAEEIAMTALFAPDALVPDRPQPNELPPMRLHTLIAALGAGWRALDDAERRTVVLLHDTTGIYAELDAAGFAGFDGSAECVAIAQALNACAEQSVAGGRVIVTVHHGDSPTATVEPSWL